MSGMFTVLAMDFNDGEVPTGNRLIATWNVEVDGDYKLYHPTDESLECAYNPEYWDWSYDDKNAVIEISTKWEIGGATSTAVRLSKRFPKADVWLTEEWTGDGEPSNDRSIYRAGVLVAATDSEVHPLTFKPAGEPDKFRDLWDANMPRVSGCMYFAIPGEQPIHVTDDQARRILVMLSAEEGS